jgi:transposase
LFKAGEGVHVRDHWPAPVIAAALQVSVRTVFRWIARYPAEGVVGLRDRD